MTLIHELLEFCKIENSTTRTTIHCPNVALVGFLSSRHKFLFEIFPSHKSIIMKVNNEVANVIPIPSNTNLLMQHISLAALISEANESFAEVLFHPDFAKLSPEKQKRLHLLADMLSDAWNEA